MNNKQLVNLNQHLSTKRRRKVVILISILLMIITSSALSYIFLTPKTNLTPDFEFNPQISKLEVNTNTWDPETPTTDSQLTPILKKVLNNKLKEINLDFVEVDNISFKAIQQSQRKFASLESVDYSFELKGKNQYKGKTWKVQAQKPLIFYLNWANLTKKLGEKWTDPETIEVGDSE